MTSVVATLDDYGRPAWIAVMVAGFILFWPVGLLTLAYLLWSGRMTCGWNGGRSRWQSRFADKFASKFESGRQRFESEARNFGFQSSGNRAFDEYRTETLKRLEDEEREFREFLDRLRKAKDKEQFEQFMADRKNRSPNVPSGPQSPGSPSTPSPL